VSREQFAELIRWKSFVWLVSIINLCFMLPQLYQLWTSRFSDGISLATLVLLVLIQGSYSMHGFFLRDKPLLWGNGLACLVSVVTLLLV